MSETAASITTTAPTTAEAPTQAAPVVNGETPEIRAGQLKQLLGIESTPAEGENAADAPAGEAAEPSAEAQAAPEATEQAKLAEARKARLAAMREKERARDAERAKRRPPPPVAPAPAPAPPPAAAAGPRTIQVAEEQLTTVQGLISLAQERGVDPVEFGKGLRELLDNPAAAQSAETKKLVEPVLQEARSMLAELKAEREAVERERATMAQTAEASQAAQAFISFASSAASQAPLAAAFLRNRGNEAFLNLADAVCAELPEGAGPQAILDQVEDALYQFSTSLGQAPSSPSNAKTATSKPPTAPGISNRDTTARGGIIDEDARWAALSVEQRAEELKRRYA